MKQSVCAICGESGKKLTEDHIPPKGLFGEKGKREPIIVLSCEDCNTGSSKEDELCRLLALEWQAIQHPRTLGVQASIVRSLKRPEAAVSRR